MGMVGPACLDADRPARFFKSFLCTVASSITIWFRPGPVPVDELERVELGPGGIDAESEGSGHRRRRRPLPFDDEVR